MNTILKHKFPYKWSKSDGYPANGIDKHSSTVFSCFACGGGSTMGYKLAGYNVIGCNEIDPKMAAVYQVNHNPKYLFVEPIQEFKIRKDLPIELFNLDVLDGSPPCSSFSMAGSRHSDWGKEKKFREGQQKQILDTLFFDYIDLAELLQPKIIVAENVKGMLIGLAKEYATKVYNEFRRVGYECAWALLDSSKMGVPQRRERLFFIAVRKDLFQFVPQSGLFEKFPVINLEFDEAEIKFREIFISSEPDFNTTLKASHKLRYALKEPDDKSLAAGDFRLRGKKSFFNCVYAHQDEICPTLTATDMGRPIVYSEGRFISDDEVKLIATFPQDYDFLNNKACYVAGMSVPPVMMAQVASRIWEQWLSKIKNNIK